MPRSVDTPPSPVLLELPNGDRYHVHPRAADLEGYLEPDRVPHLQPGITPIRVRVTRTGAGYTVSLAPDELQALLLRAQREVEGMREHPPVPPSPRDPTEGRGQRDPDARRLGPNVSDPPDPGHRGTHRHRRKGTP